MTNDRYDTLFEDYLVKIALTKTQAAKIDKELEGMLSLFLGFYNGDVDIYAQGSYSMGTTVKPLTANQSKNGKAGEYDIDIVLERNSWEDPAGTFGSIRTGIKEDDRYSSLLSSEKKESCERLIYPSNPDTDVGFHVDLVPIKEINTNAMLPFVPRTCGEKVTLKQLLNGLKTLQWKKRFSLQSF